MSNSIIPTIKVDDKIIEKVTAQRESLAQRHPHMFALVGAFGLVSTFYGFEKIIDQIPVLTNNPWILLVMGLTLLYVTGLALRKLG